MKVNKKKKGFTLIELIVVIAILGILAAVLIPKFGGFTDRARETQALTDAKQIATAMDSLYSEKGAWVASGTAVVTTSDVIAMAFDGEATTDRTWVIGKDPDTTKDGTFEWVYTVGAKTYTAGRTTANGKVEIIH